MDIGKRIKERRKYLHMSVDELAEKLGKNRATIYRYEKGEIENLPIDILEPLANALETTPQYLMGWSNVPQPSRTSKWLDKRIKQWNAEIPPGSLNDDEFDKLFTFAKFLISQRKDK